MTARSSTLLRSGTLYLLLLVLNLAVLVVLIFENQLDLIARNAMLNSRILGQEIARLLDEGSSAAAIADAGAALDVRSLAVYRDDGELIAGLIGDGHPAQADVEDIRAFNRALARRDFENRAFYHVLDRGSRSVELFVPLDHRSGPAVAHATVYLQEVAAALGYLYRQALLGAAVILLMYAGFAVYLGRTVIRPLRTLHNATRRIAAGNLDTRVAIVRNDEIGDLANAFNEMSVAIVGMREQATGSNPLTELPGNRAIGEAVKERMGAGSAFAVLYVDLDHFKAYNDTYGFARGDEVILFARYCLVSAVGEADAFIGHEGGDDFVAVCDADDWQAITERMIQLFDAGRDRFYRGDHLERGYIEALDRKGVPQQFPLVSVSIAVVPIAASEVCTLADLAERAVEAKRLAKRQPVSSFAVYGGSA